MQQNSTVIELAIPSKRTLASLAGAAVLILIVFQAFFGLIGLGEENSEYLPLGIAAAVSFFVITPAFVFILAPRFIDPLGTEYFPILLSWPLEIGSLFKKHLTAVMITFSAFGLLASCFAAIPSYILDRSVSLSLISAGFAFLTYLAVAAATTISVSLGARHHSSVVGMILSFVIPLLLANTFANTFKSLLLIAFVAVVFTLVIVGVCILTVVARYFNTLATRQFGRK